MNEFYSLIIDEVGDVGVAALATAGRGSPATQTDPELGHHLRELGDLMGELDLSVESELEDTSKTNVFLVVQHRHEGRGMLLKRSPRSSMTL
jgi:Ser/Thr protein kinase RdoA (MazF antagonist)